MPWEGNVGAKRFFLGTREGEGLSDEDLFKLFLQKEGELFTSKNSQTPFQYIKTTEVRVGVSTHFNFVFSWNFLQYFVDIYMVSNISINFPGLP